MKRVLLVISVLVISAMACQITGLPPLSQPTPDLNVQTNPPLLPTPLDPAEQGSTLEALYQQVLPGVVAIRSGNSLGSGFVFDSEGHVITNQHVIDGSSEVEVDFSSGFKAFGTVIGSDIDADVAVIKVDAPPEEIHPLAIGDSSTLGVGEQVVAIGNPFALANTMTVGIVSAIGTVRTELPPVFLLWFVGLLSANLAVELPEAVRNSTHFRTLFLAALALFGLLYFPFRRRCASQSGR